METADGLNLLVSQNTCVPLFSVDFRTHESKFCWQMNIYSHKGSNFYYLYNNFGIFNGLKITKLILPLVKTATVMAGNVNLPKKSIKLEPMEFEPKLSPKSRLINYTNHSIHNL